MFCSSRTDSLLSGSTASSVCFPAEHRSDWSDWSGWIQWSKQREHSAHSRSAPLHHCPESPPATNSQPHSAGNSLISSTHISTPTILFPTSFNKLFLKSNLFIHISYKDMRLLVYTRIYFEEKRSGPGSYHRHQVTVFINWFQRFVAGFPNITSAGSSSNLL